MRLAPPSLRPPVATFRNADATPKEAFVWHAAGLFSGAGFHPAAEVRLLSGASFQPASYIDSIILRDRDNFTGGTPIEYVRYSAYGEPTVYPVADLNMDGVVNSTDSGLWSDLIYSASHSSVYADTDLDRDDGDDQVSSGIDSDLFYESYNANLGLSGVGRVSSPGMANRTGYAGNLTDLAQTVYRGANTALAHRRLVYDAFGRLVRAAALAAPAR